MPRVGFEPRIPAFERAKTVHALDRAAIVIGTRLGLGLPDDPTSSLGQVYSSYLEDPGAWLLWQKFIMIFSVLPGNCRNSAIK
jgi:hypothetical protein